MRIKCVFYTMVEIINTTFKFKRCNLDHLSCTQLNFNAFYVYWSRRKLSLRIGTELLTNILPQVLWWRMISSLSCAMLFADYNFENNHLGADW